MSKTFCVQTRQREISVSTILGSFSSFVSCQKYYFHCEKISEKSIEQYSISIFHPFAQWFCSQLTTGIVEATEEVDGSLCHKTLLRSAHGGAIHSGVFQMCMQAHLFEANTWCQLQPCRRTSSSVQTKQWTSL